MFPNTTFFRVGGLGKAKSSIDLIVRHGRIKRGKCPTLLNQPMLYVDDFSDNRDLNVAHEPSIRIKHFARFVDLGKSQTIQSRLPACRNEVMKSFRGRRA